MKNKKLHNSRENNINKVFKAPLRIQQLFSGTKFILRSFIVVVSVGAMLVQAQFSEEAFTVRTINVFPAQIAADGWHNAETLVNQNLDQFALLQDFNSINSATLNTSANTLRQLDAAKEDVAEKSAGDTATEQVIVDTPSLSEEIEAVSETASTTETENASSTTSEAVDFDVVVPTEVLSELESISVNNQTTTTQAVEPEVSVPVESNATTTVLRKVGSLFALAVAAVESVFETETSSDDEADSDVAELLVVDDSEDVLVVSATSTAEASTETTVDTVASTTNDEIAVGQIEVTENEVENIISTTSTSSIVEIDIEEVAVIAEDIELSDVDEEVELIECVDDCKDYLIVLDDFGFPLDESVQITGAQFRLSFAAKKKVTRDHVPQFTVRYSVDAGITWDETGAITIDDEVSNSINGGYYLFAFPDVSDQSSLDSLRVELSYHDNPAVVEALFVESTWLELFVLEAPTGDTPSSFIDLLQDDGFVEEIMTGDRLVLPDGEVVDFDFTDNNKNETLIIKSDRSTYSGLSEVSTYFSVTNTTNSTDQFALQTYFPRGLGEVKSIEKFNQNKSREIVVPEYRPYVYHCEAGWEYEGDFAVDSLEDLSRQLSEPVSNELPNDASVQNDNLVLERSSTTIEILENTIENIATSSVESAASVEFAVPTSTVPVLPELDLSEHGTNTTTTVINYLPGISQLLQFSATETIATTEEPVAATTTVGVVELPIESSEDGELVETVAEDDDLVAGYSCRNTNVVRQCDEIDGGNTACRVNQVKVAEHDVTKYAAGWDVLSTAEKSLPKPGLLKRVAEFIGFGPDRKEVPGQFEARTHTPDTYEIKPGETLYFKMDITFPAFSQGEYWIEAVGKSEYGLLDPFWSSQWTYRAPIQVSNPTGSDQTEYQVFLELDSGLSDFWSNVNSDGSDIRFVQEVSQSNLTTNTGPTFENTYDEAWSDRLALVISGSSLTTSLNSFPVFVNLSDLGADFWTGVASDGKDIRITTSDGKTEVPYDLVSIDTVAETGELHFLATTLSNASDNVFHIYYNNPAASAYAVSDTYGRNAVWVNYEAVYHFDEDPTVVTNVITDMSGNGKDLAVAVAGLATSSGQLGVALDLNGSSGILTDSDWTWTAGDQIISSGWYFQAGASSEALWAWGTGNAHNFMPWYSGTTGYHRFGSTAGGTNYSFTPRDGANWHHFNTFVPTTTASSMTVHEDRVLRDTATTQVNDPSAGPLQIGRYTTGGSLSGHIDELRFSTTTLSSGWYDAEYANQSTSTSFYATSTQGIGGTVVTGWYSTSWDKRQKFTIPGSSLTADLTDFPVYLDLATLGASFFADVASDGRDIRIASDDGMTELAVEVVSIDAAAKTGQIYFKADLQDSGVNDFYVYYDNSDAVTPARGSTFGLENVWSNGYEAVYHLEEDVSGTGNSNTYKDSTSNQYDGDDENSSNGKYGLFGSGQEFGDSQTDYLSLPYQVMDGLTDNTVSWWHISSTTGDQTIVSGANGTQFNEFWERLDNNTRLVVYSQGAGETFTIDNGDTYNDDTWQYFMSTSEDAIDEMNMYRNGVGDAENPDPQPIAALDISNGGLIIGQDQDALGGNFSTNENFEGFLDELRFASIVRSAEWAAAVYENMANQTTFIATSSSETLNATNFVELDFWVQHFDDTADEADIWIQVEDLAAAGDTVIYLYYGNSGASSASDEMATFSYSTSTDLYYVVDNSGVTQVVVESLVDNNEVVIDGGVPVSLNQGESTTFGTVSSTSVISVLGPISGTLTGPSTDSSDMIVPISFATTTFAIPTNRSTNRFYMYSPFASTTVRTYIAASGVADGVYNIVADSAVTSNTDPAQSGQGVDGDGVVVESTSPILVTHRSTNPGDGLVAYPPTTRDLFGITSNYMHVSALASNSDPLASCSTGAGGTISGITRGDHEADASCTATAEGAGSAVRLSAQASAITAIQQADADGNDSTVYWPQHEFGTRYAMTNDSAYAAVVCSPRFGSVTLEIQDSTGGTISTGTCTPGATDPGKVYFNNGNGSDGDAVNYTAGHQVVATNGVPFYVIYEDVSDDQDEKNITGPVQARKFGGESVTYLIGDQEMANDAEYEQLSFSWYENSLEITPTSTWSIGPSEYVSEGEGITGSGAVDDADILRLRMSLKGSNATGTAGSVAFKLQYAAGTAGQCSVVTAWLNVGEQGSTTAAFSGYNNSGISDGATLATTTLALSTILGTYEERNYSDFLPFDVSVDDVVEFDWVIEATKIAVNTNYCFRMVRAAGTELATYTLYPELETVGPPNTPTNFVFFDNERTTTLTPVLEFSATDIAGDDIDYQVQIDDDYDFSSIIQDRNSNNHFTEFENLAASSDKSPFTSGSMIRFTSGVALSPTTTYWYRVRADDPDGSATSSDWSAPFSFTTDTTLTVSEWFQTTGDQFNTNTLSGLSTSSDAVSVAVSPGTMTTAAIDFDEAVVGNAWGEIDWNDTETAGEITIQVEYNDNGSWTLVPDSLIVGNSSGTTTSPINILELDTSIYNELRLVANFVGATLSLEDWVVRWGLRVETPTQGDLFDNQKTALTLPVFDFISTDPQDDDLEYEISFSTDITFVTGSTTYNSGVSAQFNNIITGGDTSPFNSAETITFTTPGGAPFVDGNTYWWRSRAKDPNAGDAWSPWSVADAFTVDTALTLSTWFQTTQSQFLQGVLDGAIASTSDSVEITDKIGEYGTTTITNNNWTTISTQLEYNSMVVVASPEFNFNGTNNGRTVRVRNKGTDSFEVKVDNYLGTFSGSTEVDYMVMEAGDWTVDDGGTGFRILAATAKDVSEKQAENYTDTVGQDIAISPAFSSSPIALATISSNNDSDWIAAHIDGGGYQDEVTASNISVALARSRDSASTHSGTEDIDYMVMAVVTGTNNGVVIQTRNSADNITDSGAGTALTGFTNPPAVTIVHNNGDDGAQGGFAQKDLGGANTNASIFASISEQGATADGHTANIISMIAFESAAGIITRYNGGSLSGTIAGEDIIFSDGSGPKFDNFAWNDTTPATSDVLYQMQYEVSDGVYALIPDTEIANNSTGTSTSPIDLTDVDINIYDTIRAFATLSCGGGSCPSLNDWQLEWSEGVNMSGTLQEYDRLANVAAGTLKAAVNGSTIVSTASVAAGVWTMNNVTAFAGDVVTVWVDGAVEAEEAVATFVYDGLGDITGVELFEQHLSISADENATTTNALLALNDNLAIGDEDIFFNVDGSNNLTVCSVGACSDANLYVGSGNIYIPDGATAVIVDTHDFINDGTIELDANTFNVSGSWDNNATSSTDTLTLNMTATSTAESISSTETPLNFHNLSLGAGAGNATFTIPYALDLSGNLTVASGTLDRGDYDINLAGSLTTGAAGFWEGTGTTTFDGGSGLTWTDNNSVTQNVGNIIVDGAGTFVSVTTDVAAYDVIIGGNDTLAGGSGNTIFVGGDWVNAGTFSAGTSEVEVVVDDRTYPPVVPGSADWYSDTSFVKRLPIVVDNNEVLSDLSNFPIYVDLSSLGTDFWSNVESDGHDIRVTASDGQTELPYDLVEFDNTTKEGELHFLASSVSSSATTTFYIYHSNPAASTYLATDTYGSEAVWVDYEAVYHFIEDSTAISNIMYDSTSNSYDLLVEGAGLATTTGQLGLAVDLSVSVGLLRASAFTWATGSPMTTSGWYKMTAASNESLWQFGTGSQPNSLFFEPWDNGTNRGQYQFGNTTGSTYTFTPRDTANWNHFTTLGATSTSESNYVYHDTILRETQSQTVADPGNTNGTGLQIGRTGTAGSINAMADELRFAAVLRDTDWISAEYSNQNNPDVFYATSSVETYVAELVIDEATHDISAGGSSFNHLTLNDATTSPAFTEPSVVVNGDFTVATGTVTLPTGKLTVGGSFLNSGYFQHNNAEIEFISSGASTITLNGTEFLNVLYNVTFDGSGTFTFTDTNATTSNDLVIDDGTLVFPAGVMAVGGTLTNSGGSFDANNGTILFTSAENENVTTGGSAFYNVIFGISNAASGWIDAAWGERIVIKVSSTSVNSTVSNFPVYVNLGLFDPAFWTAVQSDGADIRMTTNDGKTEIPVDMVEIDTLAETGEVHFLAPSLSSIVDTTFYIYFDNSTAEAPASNSAYGSEAVWVDYEAVYHFEGDPTLGVTDASGHGKDLAPTVGTPSTTVGQLGTALDTTSASVMLSDVDWTWTAGEDLVSSGLYFQTAFDTGALWQWGSTCTGDNCLAFLPWYDNATRGYHRVGETSGNDYNFTRDNAVWHHFTTNGRATNGAAVDIYEDNILRDTYNQTATGEDPSLTGLQIGRYQGGTYMNIQIDELRFSTSTRSTGWIETEYNNLTAASSFYSTTSESYLDVVSSFTLNEAATAAAGDVSIVYANLVAPSTNFAIGGSAQNTGGSYDPNSATTTFNSTDVGETVQFGAGAFYNLSFDGVGGGWTISTTTVTNNASLVTGADFTLATNTTMTVDGVFSNTFSAAATDWTVSTLVLTGGDYTVTDRLDSGDDYSTITVSGDSDLVIWNSSISTSTVRDTSSLYMPDYGGSDGNLRIYGDYTRVAGSEFWSYATDFDGTDLTGGSERQVSVDIGRGTAIYLATSTTLETKGVSGSTTTVDAITGIYSLEVSAGTFEAEYASFKNTGPDGLHLTKGTVVTTLTNVEFIVSGGRSGLTVDATTINAQPSSEFTAVTFGTSTSNGVYEPEWADQVILSIQSDVINETMTEYPVYVDLASLGSAFWSGVKSDGGDIRVTTDNGGEVAIDLVEIDTVAQTGELYFLAATLSANEDLVFYVHFNNSAAVAYVDSDDYGANSVWVNYEAVYHFNEDPTISITDKSGHSRTLLPTVGLMATTTGQLGTALDTTNGSTLLQNLAWTWTSGEDLISSGLYFQTAFDTGALWQWSSACGTDNCLTFLPWYDNATRGYHRVGETSGNDYNFTRNNTIWHHFTTLGRVTSGEDVEIYEDNVLRDTYVQTGTGENPSLTGLQIGRYNTGTYMDIQIDELRFATSTPSTNWIAAEYTNLTAPDTFYATSSAQTTSYNVTAAGVPTTYWLFSSGFGNIYGEAFDNDDGDPGAIQWDDSNFSVTISGVVYADDGVTTLSAPVCNGSTEVITVVLDGVTTYTAPCDPVDGSYEVTGISYSGEPEITTYINSEATETQTNVAIYKETTGTGVTAGAVMTVARPEVINDSVLVLIAGKDDNPNPGTLAGWTAVDIAGDTTGDDLAVGVWYKVVADAGTEPATYDFPGVDNGEEYSYWMGALLNVDTGTPLDLASTWVKYQNNAAPDAAEITTVTNGALVLSAWYVFNDDEVVLPTYGWSDRAADVIGAINNLSVSSQSFPTAGATGSSTLISVIDTRESHAGQFAFRPASAPTATGSVIAVAVTKTPLGSNTPYDTVEQRDQRTGFGTVNAGLDINVNRPVVENGDILVAIVAKDDDFTITPPAGWVVGDTSAVTAGNDMYTGVWYKVITNAGSEPVSYGFTSNDTGTEEYSYWVGSFAGVDTTAVFDVAPVWSNLQNTSTPAAPAITTLRDGSYAIASWYVIDDAAMTMPGGLWTTLAQDIELTNRLLAVAGQSMTTAGNTGAATMTAGTSDDVNVVQFSLNAAAISVADSVTDMDLYQNRVIVRHENIAPLTIADMAIFDNADDGDLPFVADVGASPDDLTVLNGYGLYVWNNKEFAPNGTLDLQGQGTTVADGSFNLGSNATFTSSSTYSIDIGGSFYAGSGAIFAGASSLVTFDAVNAGQQIGSAASSTITFYDLVFSGVGGGWAVQTPIVSETDILVSAGSLSGVSGITLNTGEFTGEGLVALTGGTTLVKRANTLGGSGEWTFNNLTLGDALNSEITTRATNATTTVLGTLTIATAHFLDAYGSVWDIQGNGNVFVENGSFLEGTSTVRYSGATPNILRTAYNNLVVDTESGATVTAVAPVTGLQVLGDFTLGAIGTSTLDINTNDPVFAVAGNVYIGTLGTLLASDVQTMTTQGDWDNDGVFTANGGTVDFSKISGSASIYAGSSDFANLNISGAATYTVAEHATATADMNLSAGFFTLSSGQLLAVGGEFVSAMADVDTNWTGSTLKLYSGTAYTINTKSLAETFNIIQTEDGTHPRVWNATTSVVTTNGSSSLYAMNHQGVSGKLNIFGDFVNSSSDDYWDYDNDFDGVALGIPRQAVVAIESGGSVLYTGGTLSVVGSSTASTTIDAAAAGTYQFTVGGSTALNMSYYSMRDTTIDGLILTGVPAIAGLSNGDFEVAIAGGSTMTVGGMTIGANPAQEFNFIRMATTTAIAANNITATGTSASAWRFVNVIGNLDGEDKDVDPGGDPGYLTWQDSAAIINISGNVYSDEGVSTSAACDSTTENIYLSINGSTYATTTCNGDGLGGGTGAYTFVGINYGLGNTLTVYIDNEPENAVTVTQDPISSISNFDLYENRVIIKHESGAPMTIADMETWDSDDDADVLFDVETAGTDTLVLPANTKLIVWTGKQFTPGGDITVTGGGAGAAYDGTFELQSSATFNGSDGESYGIGGSMLMGAGAVFNPALSTTTFTTTGAARTIDTNEGGFNNLYFTGSGSWTIGDTELFVTGDLDITAGTVTLPAASTTLSGSFTNSGGSFAANGGILNFIATGASNSVQLGGSDAETMLFAGTGGTWVMSDTNATATDSFTIATGTVTLPAGTLTVGNNFIVNDTMVHGGGQVKLTGTTGGNLLTLSGNDLNSLIIEAGAGDYALTDAAAALLSDLTVTTGTFAAGTGTLSIAGSFDATAGTFVHNNGTVLFNSSDTGETIDVGVNDFYSVVLAAAGGGWTIQGNATATNNFTLSTGASFTQSTNTVLYVGGVFTNNIGGSATEWIGSNLVLDSGSEYETNSKTTPAEQYNILTLGINTDISSWNAAATSTSVPVSSSWYSQDHAGTDGALNIYGDYHIATTTEYWNYATDFDGVALGGSSRAVAVAIASSSVVTVDGGVINMVGIANSTTTISNQGSGRYTFVVDTGTFNANYYSFRNTDSAGLQFTANATISSLDNGDFEQVTNNTTLITLASTTLNTNASLVINDTRFATGGFVAGTNVNLDATTTNSWSFTGAIGDLWGESYDVDGIDDCSSIRWDDSQCLLTEQAHYRWRNDNGSEGAISSTWFDNDWGARQRVRVINDDVTTYTDLAIKFAVTFDSDMQSDFDDLRFTDASGTTTVPYWIERFTSGVSADVWVKVPTVTANSATEVFMYYNNVSATSTSDPSDTFDAYDDFEDNDIVEYSGDTGLFNTAGTFAYGGGYGLDAAGNETAKATDGIGRTDIVVAQGEIIRYMQYVDTTAGSGDEVCTMFGVQSPVTDNNNYAVCLEQFGIDRISLVKDVVNTDSTGTILASSTVTFSTGWYEIEIDWQTNDAIGVALYDSSSVLVASTSATDSTYTSGGIGFTFWFQNGGWDSFISRKRTDTKPTVYFGVEQTTGGATWAAAQDTATGGFNIGETARLRVGIENTGLAIENQNFRLEFASKLTAPSCEAVSGGSFVEVPPVATCGTSDVCMTTSASTTDGDPTTDHLVTTAGDFVAGEVVADPSSQTTNLDISQNRYTELEYSINLTINATDDAYCFRVTDGGSALDSYALLPELTLAFDPIMSSVTLNDGFDITLTPGATTTITASTTVTDYNGVADLNNATTTFYRTTAGAACTADNNDCYIASGSSCSFSNCSATSCTLTCTADFQFHSDPTDPGSAFDGEEWFAFMEVDDMSGAIDFGTAMGVELLTLRALDVQNAIGYGAVDINENTGTFNPSVSLINQGNEAIDVDVAGTDMTDGIASVIPAAQQHYATTTFDYSACVTCSALSVVGDSIEVDLPKPVIDSPSVTDDVYWGVEVPFGVASNPHSGINTFTAIAD